MTLKATFSQAQDVSNHLTVKWLVFAPFALIHAVGECAMLYNLQMKKIKI